MLLAQKLDTNGGFMATIYANLTGVKVGQIGKESTIHCVIHHSLLAARHHSLRAVAHACFFINPGLNWI